MSILDDELSSVPFLPQPISDFIKFWGKNGTPYFTAFESNIGYVSIAQVCNNHNN